MISASTSYPLVCSCLNPLLNPLKLTRFFYRLCNRSPHFKSHFLRVVPSLSLSSFFSSFLFFRRLRRPCPFIANADKLFEQMTFRALPLNSFAFCADRHHKRRHFRSRSFFWHLGPTDKNRCCPAHVGLIYIAPVFSRLLSSSLVVCRYSQLTNCQTVTHTHLAPPLTVALQTPHSRLCTFGLKNRLRFCVRLGLICESLLLRSTCLPSFRRLLLPFAVADFGESCYQLFRSFFNQIIGKSANFCHEPIVRII